MSDDIQPSITVSLVKNLISQQFPSWKNLPIMQVTQSGWDNRTFHLGDSMSIRIPSSAKYAPQIQKESHWLPKLAPHLPLMIPTPIALGIPSDLYPWHWAVYEWIEGETAQPNLIDDMNQFATSLAEFLTAFQQCNTNNAPIAGPDNFHRGGNLTVYHAETLEAIKKISNQEKANILQSIWQKALDSSWNKDPVWVHGDLAINNLLVQNGKLKAVIDFGQLAIGDPACDLALYWTFLPDESKHIFKQRLNLDKNTWDRARGWVLWKTLCAPIAATNCELIINNIIDHYLHEEKN